MDKPTIIIKERVIILKQMALRSGKIRPAITIPKGKILFWVRPFDPNAERPEGVYISEDIGSRFGKIQILDTTAAEVIPVTIEELDALDEGF